MKVPRKAEAEIEWLANCEGHPAPHVSVGLKLKWVKVPRGKELEDEERKDKVQLKK